MSICKNCPQCSCSVYPQLSRPLRLSERPIMVVGETLTAIEARNNQPMINSQAADILRKTMAKVGLPTDEAHVCFTTATACAIPKRKDKSKPFPKDAIINCRDRLLSEIDMVKPRLLLICGKVAWQMFSNNMNAKVSADYGRIFHFDFVPGCDVMPIMNPALLLHSPGEYKPFLVMLQLASSIFAGKSENDTGVVTWEVLDSKEKCYAAWSHMQQLHKDGLLPRVSFDIETTGLDYRTAEFLVLGMCYEKNKAYVLPREMRSFAHNFFEGVPWNNIWHGGKYDKRIMWARKLGNVRIDDDTMYMHYAFDETSAHDLGFLSKAFLQAADYKYKMNQNWKVVTLESYPSFFEALCERVCVDCDYTFQLAELFMEKLKDDPKLYKLYRTLLIPASNFLSRVEQNGINIDTTFLNNLGKEYEKELERIMSEVQELAHTFWDPELFMRETDAKSAPTDFNPGSPAQMAWMVFDRLKLKPRIKSKGRSTNKEVLKSIEPMPLFVKKVLEYRTVQKEYSTYVLGLLEAEDEDGRVRTTFQLHVTATGRLSSKEPNIQNQPSAHGIGNIRQAFLPPTEEYVLAEIDYSGAELRWLAFLSGCPVLTNVFVSGRNLHNETATSLYGHGYTKADKLRAKAVNFGIPYGREPQSFVDEFNMTLDEAKRIIAAWLDTYYGAKNYLSWCADQVIIGNYLETPFGRRRRFGMVSPESLHSLQNEARNFPIQSSSSDLLLVCAMEVETRLKQEFNTTIINLVHDSMLLVIPAKQDILCSVAEYTNEVMVRKPIELFNCNVPFKTDFEIGRDWGNLVGFNYKTGKVEEEEGDEIIVREFDQWLTTSKHVI